jgi:hypothetical protein
VTPARPVFGLAPDTVIGDNDFQTATNAVPEAHMPNRKLPRPFEMHWGHGQITEEASYLGEYHESCIQLME